VAANNDLYTVIPVPNPFSVPGERFREAYYWDSYWIVKARGRLKRAKHLKKNFDGTD
jgi:alpha,alpha-trehalase